MPLDWLSGAIAGGITGGIGSWVVSKNLMKKQWKKEEQEKIYSPLLTELKDNLEKIENFSYDGLSYKIWNNIDKKEHLSYKIPINLLEKIKRFYNNIFEDYREKENEAREEINEVLKEEFTIRKGERNPYDLNENGFISYIYKYFFGGDVYAMGRGFITQRFDNLNTQLNNKYQNLEGFLDVNSNLLKSNQKIEEFQSKRKELINYLGEVISLIGKKLK